MPAKLMNNHTDAPWGRANRKQRKRDEAFSRDLSRSTRSSEDQMDLISIRRGDSRKEMSRLVGSGGHRVTIHVPERDDD